MTLGRVGAQQLQRVGWFHSEVDFCVTIVHTFSHSSPPVCGMYFPGDVVHIHIFVNLDEF